MVRTKKQPFFNLLTFLKQSGRSDAFSHVKRRLKPHFSTWSRCDMMSFEISLAPAGRSVFSHSKHTCLYKTAYFFIAFQVVITDNVFIGPEPTSGIRRHRAWIEIYIKISKKGSSPIRSAKQTIMPIYAIIAGIQWRRQIHFYGRFKKPETWPWAYHRRKSAGRRIGTVDEKRLTTPSSEVFRSKRPQNLWFRLSVSPLGRFISAIPIKKSAPESGTNEAVTAEWKALNPAAFQGAPRCFAYL